MSGVRVGVDATCWANRRGFGRFTRNAVGRLVELDSEASYVLFVDEHTADAVGAPAGAEVCRVAVRRAPSEAAAADGSRSVADILRMTRAVRAYALDAFLFPAVYSYFPVVRVPTIVGVHDTIVDRFPELTMPSRRARAFWRAKEGLALRRAACVFTVSEASRDALSARSGLDPRRLGVVPEAPDPVFGPLPELERTRRLASIGIAAGTAPFVYAGGVSPHKDVETLIAAYAEISRAGSCPPLVVVGDLDSEAYLSSADSVRARIAALGAADRVILPGYVSDGVLAALYGSATAVVIPSLAEGFGLPAVEAAACGAAVILSDIPPHRETLGGAARFFPPGDVPALVDAMASVLHDDGLRRGMGERARAGVEGLSWDKTARSLGDLIHAVAA